MKVIFTILNMFAYILLFAIVDRCGVYLQEVW